VVLVSVCSFVDIDLDSPCLFFISSFLSTVKRHELFAFSLCIAFDTEILQSTIRRCR